MSSSKNRVNLMDYLGYFFFPFHYRPARLLVFQWQKLRKGLPRKRAQPQIYLRLRQNQKKGEHQVVEYSYTVRSISPSSLMPPKRVVRGRAGAPLSARSKKSSMRVLRIQSFLLWRTWLNLQLCLMRLQCTQGQRQEEVENLQDNRKCCWGNKMLQGHLLIII